MFKVNQYSLVESKVIAPVELFTETESPPLVLLVSKVIASPLAIDCELDFVNSIILMILVGVI